MDTPKIPGPQDEGEKQVLQNLNEILTQLQLRKLDRTTYVRTQDVMVLYDRTIEQVKQLNEIRNGKKTDENTVDRVVDSCFQLLSLFFMTIGRNNEAPAAYALTSTIKRLLDHLTEADIFSAKDLESMSQALERLSAIVENHSRSKTTPLLETLLSNRVYRCRESLANLKKKLEVYAEPILATYEKLVSILRQTAAINTKSTFKPEDIHKFQAQLKEIDEKRVDGHFIDADGSVLAGSEQVCFLLDRCQNYTEVVLEKAGKFPEQWKHIYDILIGIRNELDKLSLTQAWSLRETDLYDYQRQLDKIDKNRVDGNWLDEKGQPADLYVQRLTAIRTLLYLIRKSYGYIYHLMISSEPVSEALLPIYNQLHTLKRCLVEVQNSGGVSSVRELYPYSMKLHSIDNMKVDGKFMVGEDIPEGQGSVAELLAECFELNYELRVAAEAAAEKEGQP
ncbi:uncharacterized protein BCR38DRAFT_514239 [Pseudomassariella vexata]|uniref:Uncharacterized protein n=1 Tax=Pseudomassariella vexata TaxID=1141098 RepID=A0A1Y2E3S5_9PEZI|nr:uncharacterized protein BCR38DRAFT_514239 [Pseudomassariella vexata]ORY65525.1 hypothetical protein BCR38DRAFT_514239 [Pseudomassariella vexata]